MTHHHSTTNRFSGLFALALSLTLTLALSSAPVRAAPLELRLEFQATGTSDGKSTTVTARSPGLDISTNPHPFTDPLASESQQRALSDLRWYLEHYSSWPIEPERRRAERVQDNLVPMGGLLFHAVFGQPEALRIWQQFRDAPDSPKHLTIDSRDPDILKLPWELLADERSHLFTLGISIRRRVHESTQRIAGGFQLPIRILMVTARPKETGFIDPRIAPRALLDAVAGLGEAAVQVEFLDTPTFAALGQRLRDGADGKSPPIHVVHFDGHGKYDAAREMGFLAFEDAHGHLNPVDAGRIGQLMAKARTPLLLLDACQSATVDGPDPFRSVAPRLMEAGVGAVVAMPYSVLVKTSEIFFQGFYRSLAEGGTIGQAVDAGRWALHDNRARDEIYYPPDKTTVPVELADWFLPVLYQRGGRDGDPAPFANAAGTLPWERQHPAGITNDCHFLEPRVAENLLGEFPEPSYCFVGRSRELWDLQRHLRERQVVVLHGMAGQGKTATATEAARWLVRTGRFARAVFVSFQGGGDKDWALTQLGEALIGPEFAKLPHGQRLPTLRAELARAATLIVWDNFESVLPGWEAKLPGEALEELLEAGLALTGSAPIGVRPPPQSTRAGDGAPDVEAKDVGAENAGAKDVGAKNVEAKDVGAKNFSPLPARLIITTRDPGLAQHHPGYAPARRVAYLALEGMITHEALALAGSVLDDRGLARPPREALEDLLAYLGGHPLSILLVLPRLADYDNDVARVIRRFEAIYPGFTEGKAKARNESLEASLQFSLERLGGAARAQLPVLGAFAQGASGIALSNVSASSRQGMPGPSARDGKNKGSREPASRDGFDKPSARDGKNYLAQLEQAGLLSVKKIPVSAGALAFIFGEADPPRESFAERRTIPFYRFHPTLAPHLRGQWSEAEGQRYRRAHQRFYYALANRLYHLDSRDPLSARKLARREMPNLRAALDRMLADKDPDAVRFATAVERFLKHSGRWRERDALRGEVKRAFPDDAAGPLTKAAFLLESGRGERRLDAGQPQEAEPLFRGLLRRFENADYDAGYDRAATLTRLGRSLRLQGKGEAAAEQYRKALAALGELDPTNRIVRKLTGSVRTDLADVLRDAGRYREARSQYEKSLAIKQEIGGDTRGEAVVNFQLGTLALLQGEYGEARSRYRAALERFQAMGEQRSIATIYHQLGMVDETEAESASGEARQGLLQEAGDHYRQSLRLKEQMGDQAGAAKSANQLAIVARSAGRYTDAEGWYEKAIELDRRTGNRKELAIRYNNLADLLKNVHRLHRPGSAGGQRPAAFAGRDLLAEAEAWARKSVEINEAIGDPSLEIWKDYSILAHIADARAEESEAAGDTAKAGEQRAAARGWRRKERAAYAAFPGHWANMTSRWEPIVQAIRAGVAGDEALRAAVGRVLDGLAQTEEGARLGRAIRAIFAGARDADSLAEAHGLDGEGYVIARKILE